ncbi:MAG TPA: rhodanese-like domain-containing protein [Candidatus Acidoferrales bacterium]|nr:rhodanese-like domain-containing protein [Candidatus Acidoferrales bacterium]
MMKWIAALLLVAGLAFCSSSALAQDDLGMPDDASMTPPPTFIKPAEVLKMMQDKDTSFVLVDTQPEEAFADGHIPGAINYPWVPQVKPPISLPRDKMLVFYCPCNHDEDSIDMYKKLAEFGYLNAKILEGGWYKWVALKYPVDGTDAADAIKMANAAAANGSTADASSPALAATSAGAAPADTAVASTSGPLTSGRPVGAVTPSLRVIDVTGKYKGQDTCYVCEYGTAPTVIGFFQKPSDQAAALIVKLNTLVQSNKNLKGFIVMINGPESKDWLTKLAADKGITIPMVYLAKGTQDTGMRLYKLNPSADNTILVDDNRQVFANFVNTTDTSFQQVVDASTKMLASAPAPASGNGQ